MPIDRPVPALYCCYLLRSTIRYTSVYVGSTPNPVRRLRQHNGDAKGGAVRTNRPSLRPWEMSCIVTGFPSHIAALQFEWAWQNPHVTLHIPPESRLQYATQKKRSGHPKRPHHTVASLLSNLHLLLRVPSFSRWPLEIRFFSEDVHRAWLKWTKTATESIPDTTNIVTDFPPAAASGGDRDEEVEDSPRKKRRKTSHGIEALDIDYTAVKPHVEKGKDITDFEREGSCSICLTTLEHDSGVYAICPHPSCESVTHLTCLSKHFLHHDEDSLVPIKGTCPVCRTELRWIDVVKELTLRLRGPKEVRKLLKSKKAPKTNTTTASLDVAESSASDEEDDAALEEEMERMREFNPTIMSDGWHAISDSDDSGTGSITRNASQAKKATTKGTSRSATLPMVIEDSDWDDADILD